MQYEANVNGPSLFIFGQAYKPGAIIPDIEKKLDKKTLKALLDSERIKTARARKAPKFEGTREAPEAKTNAEPEAATPKDALSQDELKGKTIEDLNVMAIERGYTGEAFTKVGEAKLWLSANKPAE